MSSIGRCLCQTKKGTQCTRKAVVGSKCCTQHSKMGLKCDEPKRIPVRIRPQFTELPPFDIQQMMSQLPTKDLLNLMKTNKQMYQLGKPILDKQKTSKFNKIIKYLEDHYISTIWKWVSKDRIKNIIRSYVMNESNLDDFIDNIDTHLHKIFWLIKTEENSIFNEWHSKKHREDSYNY